MAPLGGEARGRGPQGLPSETEPRLPLIGAHVRQAGGFAPVPERAVAIGAEVAQVFNSNPRTWHTRVVPPEEMAVLTAGLRKYRLPLFVHTIYLLNLASPDEQLRMRSGAALTEALVMGARASAAGVVTHIGSHRGAGFAAAARCVIRTVSAAMEAARVELGRMELERTEPQHADGLYVLPPLLLENGAGSGGTVGADLSELAELLGSLPPTCGLCLDTAHLFAAGYEVHTVGGLQRLVAKLGEESLLARLRLVHLNDSRTPFGSRLDRHENPGEGQIGLAGLARVVRHPAFRRIPFVLEVAGPEGRGPDAATLALVKRMRAAPASRPEAPAPGRPRPGCSGSPDRDDHCR